MAARRWWQRFGKQESAPDQVSHVNAVDRNGQRYTTHCFAGRGDWWWGAKILTNRCIVGLERDGLLPLTEVKGVEHG